MFKRVLVANRGEIAVRVIRACRELGIRAVAVYSDVDRDALHVRLADEAYPIGPASPRESYLAIPKLLEVARRTGSDAVHPGYGFLSESAEFADAVHDAGLVFVGPPGDVQRRLGEKTQARRLAREAGVPVAEGTLEPLQGLDHARREAERIGYPVMLKAAAGGGGKGMRAVNSVGELDAAWRLASGEAAGAFGSAALFVEKLIENARHIEMQFLADAHGGIVWLGERDCSIQRRHQKLIEESPAPSVDDALRERLGDAAVRIARAAGYQNAGTAEFLVDSRSGFSFLEVNTRLQVEHPVTELVTGLDLVALQLRIAAGEPLPFAQKDVRRSGAAIECRVTAEDVRHGFIPATGRIALLREPAGPGVRVDSGLFAGLTVTSDYDPLLMKLIAHGADRTDALARARRAVRETIVAGLPTSLAFHSYVLDEPDFIAGRYGTGYVAAHWPPRTAPALDESAVTAAALVAVLATRGRATRRSRGCAAVIYEVSVGDRQLRVDVAGDGRFLIDDAVVAAETTEIVRGQQWSVRIAGRSHEVTLLTTTPMRLLVDGHDVEASALDERAVAAARGTSAGRGGRHELRAPMPGLLKTVHVAEGDLVERDAPLMTLEAMKMENELLAPARGRVVRLAVGAGTKVEGGAMLAVLEAE